MSLINNILSGLNKRGANALPGKSAVRTAPAPKNRIKELLIGGAVLGLVCAAGWLWWSRHKTAAPVSVAQAPAKPISASQTISPPVEATSGASEVEVSQPIAASQPVAAVTQEVLPTESVSKESGQKESVQETEAAALSPKPELEVPPPSSVRAKPLDQASRRKHNKAALLAEPVSEAKSAVPDDESRVVPVQNGGVDKQVKPLSVQQQADNEFRRANGLMQQGHIDEALAGYEAALQLDAGHDAARQAMVVLLLEKKRNADAERILQDGLKRNIKNSRFAMLLARIQIERDASWSALLVLQKTLPYAEQQADYQAFVAALLQRLNRHKEAVMHYQAAVQLSPNSGIWWMGLGISLRALQQNAEAGVAFKHALESGTLNADLQTFVAQQLRGL